MVFWSQCCVCGCDWSCVFAPAAKKQVKTARYAMAANCESTGTKKKGGHANHAMGSKQRVNCWPFEEEGVTLLKKKIKKKNNKPLEKRRRSRRQLHARLAKRPFTFVRAEEEFRGTVSFRFTSLRGRTRKRRMAPALGLAKFPSGS